MNLGSTILEYQNTLVTALKITFSKFSSYLIFGTTFVISVLLYIWAIQNTASVQDFLNSTKSVVTIVNIFFILFNSFLFAFALTFIVEGVRRKTQTNQSANFLQAVVSIFFSVVSTGCYVCGTVLLPAIGVTASLATLPFAGIEIKFLTMILLLYSVYQGAKNVVGICLYVKPKQYRFLFGNKSISVSNVQLFSIRPFLITGVIVALIYILPLLSASFGIAKPVVAKNDFVCSVEHS